VSTTVSTPDGGTIVESDGFRATSTSETPDQITEILKPAAKPEEGAEPVSDNNPITEAARTLGKKSAETAAAKKAQETPEGTEETPAPEAAKEADRRKGNPRHDPTARVAQATREAKEAREEAARLRAELEQTRTAKPGAEKQKEAAKADGPPKLEDFDLHEQWVEAMADYKADQRLQKYIQETATKQREAAEFGEFQTKAKTHFERVQAFKKTVPDYMERTADFASTLTPSRLRDPERDGFTPRHVLSDEILNSEIGPALTLHYADHPEEVQRLEAMEYPWQVQRAVAIVEGRLQERSTAAPLPSAAKTEISKAKDPVRPVAGSPHTAGEPGTDAPYEAHRAYWAARDRDRQARR
jgi:hypothetical protein